MLKKGCTAWNKGKTGLAGGWSDKRRRSASIKQKQWCKDNSNANFFKYDRTRRWKTGPDPEVRKHYYRFLRMRAQAKYWNQEWTIKWEDYLNLLKSSSGKWGRHKDNINLVRRDTTKGWHIDNVQLMNRGESMRRSRSIDPKTGKTIRRSKRNGK